MTILVGLLCADGVVIGSDSSTTFSAGQIRTIEQTSKKVRLVNDNVMWAGTGQVGLGQRFQAHVERYWKEKRYDKKTYIDIGREISALSVQDFASTRTPTGQFGALLAFPVKSKEFHLCEFGTNDMQPEFKTKEVWYVSMGSGQGIADPFLGLLRNVFWGNSMPLLNEGIFYVTWALQHTIMLNPGGINGPMQIATLSYDEKEAKAKARLLEASEILEHENNVTEIIEHLRKYKEILQGKNSKRVPELSDIQAKVTEISSAASARTSQPN
jgi:hypothetical protein